MRKAPKLVRQAAERYPEMLQALRRYRAAFLYELPADGRPVEGGAVCAIMADVSRRFTPHLGAWRAAGGAEGGAAAAAAIGASVRLGLNGSEPWLPVEHGNGGKSDKSGRGRARARGKGKGKGKKGKGKRELKRGKRAAAEQRQAHEGSGRPLSQLYGVVR